MSGCGGRQQACKRDWVFDGALMVWHTGGPEGTPPPPLDRPSMRMPAVGGEVRGWLWRWCGRASGGAEGGGA